jgi:hypothetical protein
MKKLLLILLLFITLSASAQIDSTEIHRQINEWYSNPSNAGKRVPYFDDNGNLVLSMIGIAIVGFFISKSRNQSIRRTNKIFISNIGNK